MVIIKECPLGSLNIQNKQQKSFNQFYKLKLMEKFDFKKNIHFR